MKLFKKGHEPIGDHEVQDRAKEKSLWKDRMKSTKVFKMSQGATNIFRMIKDRSKWGEKSFLKNKFWNKRRPWKKND